MRITSSFFFYKRYDIEEKKLDTKKIEQKKKDTYRCIFFEENLNRLIGKEQKLYTWND